MQAIRIAVTGGIGSGKSTVLNLIKEFGYPTFSCDEIYHELRNNPDYLAGLKKIFPQIFIDNRADFKKLSQIVFQDKEALSKLNSYSHPLIVKHLLKNINSINEGLSFSEVPLLFESNLIDLFDYVIIVKRPVEDRVLSVCKRDRISKREVFNRMNNQFDYEKHDFSKQKNIFILENNQKIEQLSANLFNIISNILQLWNIVRETKIVE